MDDYARDVLALLDHLRAAEAIVCGLSMGGYVSLALWRLAPRRIRGFVLADTRPDADTGEVRAGRERMLETLACRGVQAVAEGMVGRLLGPTSLASRPPVVERVRQIAASQRAEAVGPAIARLMTRPDSTELLPGIDCPVLVVAGREDEITPPDVAQQMHGQLADASLALIGHAGHLSSLEQPEAFSAALDRFLAARFLQA
jgi:pimeloyl-ACP methyl ester carboxylesterase